MLLRRLALDSGIRERASWPQEISPSFYLGKPAQPHTSCKAITDSGV